MDLSIDPVAFITTECITVTSAMRKNTRWAASSTASILGGSTANSRRAQKYLASREGVKKKSKEAGVNGSGGDDDGTGDETPVKRWGLRPDRSKMVKPNPLMSAFARLRGDLKGCKDIHQFDVPALLHPFLQVIRSSSTSASITAFALIAITKFFSYRIIQADSPRLALGMQLLSAAITHCRFEASETTADEYVLQLILELMEDMLSGPGGNLLSDESVCEMMETGLSMCCQSRLSEQLRRLAERKMVTTCQIIFERLKTLEADHELEPPDALPTKASDSTAHMEVSLQGLNAVTNPRGSSLTQSTSGSDTPREPSRDGRPSTDTLAIAAKSAGAADRSSQERSSEVHKSEQTPTEPAAKIKPYSLPSIRELFRVLVNLLEPDDKQHTDAMRVMALRIIDVAIEIAGTSIARHPSLAHLARDDLCRNLFQLVRTENMVLLNESLRVAGTLLATCRPVLKLQQELYLSYLVACLHPKIGVPHDDNIDSALYEGVPQAPKLVKANQADNGRVATPVPVQERARLGLEGGVRRPEAREAMVENLGALARMPTFMVELFVNYDCEIDRVDLCEEFISLLARNAFPDAANWSTKNVPPLCLDSLLMHIQFIHDRLDVKQSVHSQSSKAETLRNQRARKKLVIAGASRFNTKPKDGLSWLAEQGIIPSITDAVSVARFLRGTSRINKAILGEYIAKRGNEELLAAYIDQFDFSGKRIDEALRLMLGTFRLPGESGLIERIIVAFAARYMKTSMTEDIADGDAAYVLVYAVIMLNTDQHNPNIKVDKRMTQEGFARNLRGVNSGKDFGAEYLQDIFEEIKTNEIILPDEHDNKHAFEYAWKELLLKTESTGDLISCNTNEYDADMFDATWRPILATLAYVFMSATEDAVFERVIIGYEQCAEIAARYGLHHILDHIVYCLSTMSTLAIESIPSTVLNTEVTVKKRKVMVSEMAVKFGRLPKAQLATVVLFAGVVQGREESIRAGWTHLARIFLNLFANSQLPTMPDQLRISIELPPLPVRTPGKVIDKDQQAQNAGLFSSFTSLITSYAADEPPEPSDEEVGDTIRTYECLAECGFGDMLITISGLPLESLNSFIRALLDQLPQDAAPVVAVVKPEPLSPNASRPNGQQRRPKTASYNPAVAFILELASTLVIKNKSALESVGKEVVEGLRDVLRNGMESHPLVLSRAVFYLLHILSVSHEHTFVRAPVILHTIDSLSQDTLEQCALPILKGLAQCLSGPRPLRNEVINTPDFWFIIRRLGQNTDVASNAFTMLKSITEDSESAVTADNYEVVVLALNDFASAGSAGAALEQARDKARRMKQQVKPLDIKGNEHVSRSIEAIALVYKLSSRVPSLIGKSNLVKDEAWSNYWTPIFRSLSAQCTNPCREIRHHAFGALQRALLSPDVSANNEQAWKAIFNDTLFPLVITLLKPEVYHTDPAGMPATRVQALSLLCKVFLNYLSPLSEWQGMEELWLRILDVMDRLMNSGQPADAQVEALHESLKNTLLVMASSEFLTEEPADAASTKLWIETKKKLERFQPEMAKEIFPERKVEVPSKEQQQSSAAAVLPAANQSEPEAEPEAKVEAGANPEAQSDPKSEAGEKASAA